MSTPIIVRIVEEKDKRTADIIEIIDAVIAEDLEFLQETTW